MSFGGRGGQRPLVPLQLLALHFFQLYFSHQPGYRHLLAHAVASDFKIDVYAYELLMGLCQFICEPM
jgi:hypothetical protein